MYLFNSKQQKLEMHLQTPRKNSVQIETIWSMAPFLQFVWNLFFFKYGSTLVPKIELLQVSWTFFFLLYLKMKWNCWGVWEFPAFTEIFSNPIQRYTYRVLKTIQMKLILLCVWADPAVLGSSKTALKFKYEI